MLQKHGNKMYDTDHQNNDINSCGRDIYISSITASGVNYCNAGKNDTDHQKNYLNREAEERKRKIKWDHPWNCIYYQKNLENIFSLIDP